MSAARSPDGATTHRSAGRLGSFLTPWRQRWQCLQARERIGVSVALALVGTALIWTVAIAPAWRVLREADSRHQALQTELERMRTLQTQAQMLQGQPRVTREAAVAALESSVRQTLGPGAQIQIGGERATLTLRAVPAGALAAWLTQARTSARALPVEMRLVRSAAPADAVAWDGTLVLSLPER